MEHTEELREKLTERLGFYLHDNDIDFEVGYILSLLHKLNYQKVIYQDEEFVTTAKFKETHCEPIEVDDDGRT